MAANTIYFGTNRRVTGDSPVRFGNEFHADKPYYFRVGEVQVEKTGHSWKTPNEAYRCGAPILYDEKPGPDPVLGSAQLFGALHDAMLTESRDVIVFLHGFNTSFEAAMERAAELRDQYLAPPFDPETGGLAARGRREPMVFAFAWPSDGVVIGDGQTSREWAYSSDREDARASGLAMARCAIRMFGYLSELAADQRCNQRVHLVAHSMGGWALRHAVQELVQLAAEAGQPLLRVFENVFLMASDLESDALEREDWLAPLLRLARYVHVYHANNDSALSASDSKPGHGARLGHLGPANIPRLGPRVTAVDCANVSFTPGVFALRHQYYRMAPEVVADVRDVLANKPPQEMRYRDGLGENRFILRLDHPAREKLRRRR